MSKLRKLGLAMALMGALAGPHPSARTAPVSCNAASPLKTGTRKQLRNKRKKERQNKRKSKK